MTTPAWTEAPGELVEVLWVDSTGHSEWHEPEEARDLLRKVDCRVAGYLVCDEPEGIVVALGAGALGQYMDSMAIPRAAIVSMTRLSPSKKASA